MSDTKLEDRKTKYAVPGTLYEPDIARHKSGASLAYQVGWLPLKGPEFGFLGRVSGMPRPCMLKRRSREEYAKVSSTGYHTIAQT
jgi:hypothetical protein